MKKDAIAGLHLKAPHKVPCKETVNNPSLFLETSGIDPYENLEGAFVKTISKLGIDFVSGVPRNSQAIKMNIGETHVEKKEKQTIARGYLGVMPTYSTLDYGFDSVEDVLNYDPEKENPLDIAQLKAEYDHEYLRNCKLLGDYALPYHLYYTTLFMWPVQIFGWELFMEAALVDPTGFDNLLEKFKRQSIKHITAWSELDIDYMMVHDDLCMGTGPVFRPEWYEKYIFPRYPEIFAPLIEKEKIIIFTSDGNLDVFLDDLVATGVDGFMVETPATDFDNILSKYGKDKVIIGGIDTKILTFSSPDKVYEHTKEVLIKGREYPGFFISSPGGLHGNIPFNNLQAYFAAQKEYGRRR